MKIRMSQLPQLSKCRASARQSEGVTNAGNDFTASGRAWHKVAENYLANVPSNAEHMAAYYGVAQADVEEAIEKLSFVADFRAHNIEAGHLWIYDWKSGFGEVDPPARNLQLIGYALAVDSMIEEREKIGQKPFENIGASAEFNTALFVGYDTEPRNIYGHPDLAAWNCEEPIHTIHIVVIYPRTNKVERADFMSKNLWAWHDTIKGIVREAQSETPEYRVGDHCSRCNGRLTCPVLNKEIILAANATDDTEQIALFSGLSASHKGSIYQRAKAAASVAKEIMDLAKSEVDAGREVRFSDGTVLAKIEKSVREIDPVAGWEVVKDYAECLSASVPKLEKAFVDANAEKTESGRAKKGEPERVKKEFYQRMTALGALNRKPKIEYRALMPAEIETMKKGITDGTE